MVVDDLTVDQFELPGSQLPDQVGEGDLGCVRTPGEHGLSEEHASEGYPVKPADEIAVAPRFHGVGEPQFRELQVGALHRRRDPGPGALARRRAAFHNRLEVGVHGHRIVAPSKPLGETPRDLHAVGCEHGARVGRPPQHGAAVVVEPGKDAVSVCAEKTLRGQIAANRNQTLAARMPGIGKRRLDVSDAGVGGEAHSVSMYFSASRAAMHPNPADVMAWR